MEKTKTKSWSPFDKPAYKPIDFNKKYHKEPSRNKFDDKEVKYIDKGHPKQILINFLERLEAVDFTFSKAKETDQGRFYSAIITRAPRFVLSQIINDAPEEILCHINPDNQQFEVFINAECSYDSY